MPACLYNGLEAKSRAKGSSTPWNPVFTTSRKGKKHQEQSLGLLCLFMSISALILVFRVRQLGGTGLVEEPESVGGVFESTEAVDSEEERIVETKVATDMQGGGGTTISFYMERVIAKGNETEIMISTSDDDQPLVQMFPQYVQPQEHFVVLKNNLLASSKIEDKSLFQENFGYTSGWMIRFNKDGIQRVMEHPKFKYAFPFFEMARNPEANAFVMNLLICHQPPEGEHAVSYHLDNSVGIKNEIAYGKLIVAHQVNVLYLDIPNSMEGGALEVWPFSERHEELGKAIVRPTSNLMVEFRGDAYHRVGSMKLQGEQPRTGIVLEQYKVPEAYYPYTLPFCAGDECSELSAEVLEQ